MAEISFSKEVKNILSEALAGETSKLSKDSIFKLTLSLRQYLEKLEQWNLRASQYFSNFIFVDPNASKELKRYIVSKEMIKKNPEIEQLLKEGYIVIDMIREFITGESITYHIGVEYQGGLYEGNLTLEQIMNIAKVEPVWKSSADSLVKLRLSGSNKRSLIESMSLVEKFKNTDPHSSLYSSIRAYASSTKKNNKGNIYEAYRVLKGRYGANTTPPAKWDIEEFEQVYLETVQNTASYVKGGDILTEQIKFFGSSVPSLTTLATIRKTFETLIRTFNNFNMIEAQNSLRDLFLKDGSVDKASKNVDKFIEDTLEELIRPLNKT